MDLRLRMRNLETATLFEVGGEIDLHSAPQLRAALAKSTETLKPHLVVDLTEVSFIDSTGVGVLVGALKRARENGGELHFCGAASRVRRVFEITGLWRVLPFFESREAALAGWTPANSTPVNASPATPTVAPIATSVAVEVAHE